MKFNDIIKQSNKINFLKEAFTGEFTVGFELEGICTWEKDTEDENFHLPRYGSYNPHSELNQPYGGARLLKNYLDELFKLEGSTSESKIESDSSLDTKGFSYDDFDNIWNFEYATNKIPFNAKNLEKIYNGLSQLNEEGIYTNDSCGFHIHMSFPEIDKKEIAWIMCCIAIDKDLLQDILKLDTEYGTIQLFNSRFNGQDEIGGYATFHYLLDLGNAIEDKRYNEISELLNNEKYKVLHIHSENGTIEWRGPRGFLNYDDDKVIKSFILKWFKFVSKIAKMTQVSSYTGTDVTITKNELLSRLNLQFSLESDIEKKKKENKKKLFDSLIETPVKLFSFSSKAIKNLYEYNSRELIKIIYSLVVNDMFGEDWALLKKEVFNMIFQLYSIYFIGRDLEVLNFVLSLWYPLKSHGISLLQKLDTTNKNMIIYICSNILLNDLKSKDIDTEEFDEIIEDLDILNTEVFKKELNAKVKNNDVIDFDKILNITTNLPTYIWNILLNNKYIHYTSMIENIPEKYQLKMVKKDPYNIQYINTPSEKVIKSCEKLIPNIKNYIRGE